MAVGIFHCGRDRREQDPSKKWRLEILEAGTEVAPWCGWLGSAEIDYRRPGLFFAARGQGGPVHGQTKKGKEDETELPIDKTPPCARIPAFIN